MDGEKLGVALYAAKTSYPIPFANEHAFIERLLKICKKEKASLLFPGLDAELMILSLNKDLFKSIGTTVIDSDQSVIRISDDKQLTYD